MKFIECVQGTTEWYSSRTGRITASRFTDATSTVGGLNEQQAQYVAYVHAGASIKEAAAKAGYKAAPTSDIIRRALAGEWTEEFSDTARRYAADLAIERISSQPHGEPVKAWVLERGHTMEEIARREYESRTGSFVTEAGICLTDDDVYGYSTDGLVDDDGLIEIKAPIDSIKILAMLNTGDTSEYNHQMQGGLWITGRKWCDFIMYVPDLAAVGRDLFVKRIFRDEAFISAMVDKLADFNALAITSEAAFRGNDQPQEEPMSNNEQFPESSQEQPSIDTAHSEALDMNEDLNYEANKKAWRLDADHATALIMNEVMDRDRLDAAELARIGDLQLTAAHAEALADDLQFDIDRSAAAAGVTLPAATPVRRPSAQESTPPTLKLGQIGARLGFNLTADFLRSLGFEPAARDKSACLYHEADFATICAALISHISAQVHEQVAA